MKTVLRLLFVPLVLCGSHSLIAAEPSAPPPVQRALGYLSREVPRWSVENHCFSCHNNGDAARALYVAVRRKHELPAKSLIDTTNWLIRPEKWDHNGGEGPFSDKSLATMQFAATLSAAVQAGLVREKTPLRQAADLVAALQQPDGSWKIDGPDTIGSPATWGRFLVTAMCRNLLQQTDAARFRPRVEKADRWLRHCRPETVLDAAAVLLGLGNATDEAAEKQRAHCLALLHKGESGDGGWGPYVHSPPEPFDTAVVLLALASQEPDESRTAMIRRGRAFLVRTQLDDGSWPETTRPAEAVSYAQRLSTAGWATRALLETAGTMP